MPEISWNDIVSILPAISAFSAGIGLIFTALTFNRNRKTNELQITEKIVGQLQDLEREFYDKYLTKSDEDRKKWDRLFFNTLEWFSFLINEKKITDKKIINFFKDAIISWYEKNFLPYADKNEIDDPKTYTELKKLYNRFKDQTK